MKIAIIGPGNMGLGLARLLIAKDYIVTLAHKDPQIAKHLAAKIGTDYAQNAHNISGSNIATAVIDADIVILATPYNSVKAVLKEAGDLAGKILVDITNPITPDYMALTIGHTTSAAEEIAKLAPKAHVVKAFNTVFWQALPFEVRRNSPAIQIFLASDNDSAKKKVAKMVRELEFEAIDAGPLTNSRYIEPIGELNIHFGYALGWGTAISPSWIRLAK